MSQSDIDKVKAISDRLGVKEADILRFAVKQILQKLVTDSELAGGNSSGTLRFLRAATTACRAGVPRSHLVSYKVDGALIQELFSLDGIGTQIVEASAEQVRLADIDDIGGILDLIRPLEEQGILVRRSREQLEQEIHQFTIIEKDGLIIGCAALYPYVQDKMAEMACVAIHPEYRDGNRGLLLLNHMKLQSKAQGLKYLFVLTTHSLHWFREQGFHEMGVNFLPSQKQNFYNYQRKSKVLAIEL